MVTKTPHRTPGTVWLRSPRAARGGQLSGGLSNRRTLIIVDNIPPEPVQAASDDIACRPSRPFRPAVGSFAFHRPSQEDRSGRGGDEHVAGSGGRRPAEAHVAVELGGDFFSVGDDNRKRPRRNASQMA